MLASEIWHNSQKVTNSVPGVVNQAFKGIHPLAIMSDFKCKTWAHI